MLEYSDSKGVVICSRAFYVFLCFLPIFMQWPQDRQEVIAPRCIVLVEVS